MIVHYTRNEQTHWTGNGTLRYISTCKNTTDLGNEILDQMCKIRREMICYTTRVKLTRNDPLDKKCKIQIRWKMVNNSSNFNKKYNTNVNKRGGE